MLLAAALSVLLWNLLFIPPVMTFKIERLEDALMCFFSFWWPFLRDGSLPA